MNRSACYGPRLFVLHHSSSRRIAAAYGLSLATRDVADFEGSGLDLINPWEAPADR
jgi:hypothetical protein